MQRGDFQARHLQAKGRVCFDAVWGNRPTEAVAGPSGLVSFRIDIVAHQGLHVTVGSEIDALWLYSALGLWRCLLAAVDAIDKTFFFFFVFGCPIKKASRRLA